MLPDNPRLRTALGAAAGDAERQGEVLAALLDGTAILALVPGERDTGRLGITPIAKPPPLAVARDAEGVLTALLFSGPETFAAWGGSNRAVCGPGRAMAAMVRDQGVFAAVLDVAGPVAAALDHADLRALA